MKKFAGSFVLAVAALSTAQAADKVTVRLAFNYNGHRSPYLLGVTKGFYSAEGLDVDVAAGRGYMPAMQLLASGQDTFAIVDAPTIMLAQQQGMPVKQICQVYHKSPDAVISWKSANIKGPKDLPGKTVAVIQGDTQAAMVKALMRRNNLDPESVNFAAAEGGTRNQIFLNKKADAINGFSIDTYIGMKDLTQDQVNFFLMSDNGIDLMGDGIAVQNNTIKNSPDLIRRFVRATIRAFDYAVVHPEEAIEALAKASPSVKKNVELDKLKATVAFIKSPEAAKYGMCYSIEERWAAAEALMKSVGGLTKPAASVHEYYTNDFVPKK